MPSSPHRDPAVFHHSYELVPILHFMTDTLLTEMWDLVADTNNGDKFAKFTAKDVGLSSQLRNISLRINEIEIKLEKEHALQVYIRQIFKGFKSQRRRLMNWLQGRERVDELEDAFLAGDMKLSVSVALEQYSVLRLLQSLAYDELLYSLHLVDSTRRTAAYMRQYAEVVIELLVLQAKSLLPNLQD